jgi:crotonobetainyl-CoA:carnitine CoA-transferase CaiB-like acyl-CoA transferase
MRLVGHPEVIEEEWFATGAGRAAHADLLDGMVDSWIRERTCDEAVAAFADAGAAAVPVYDVVQVMDDPQYAALDSVITVADDDLGPIKMQNVIFRMSETPGAVRYPGRRLGQDNDEVYAELGVDDERRNTLSDEGVI